MGTFFEWFPREVGLDKNPDAFRTDCYKYYWGSLLDGAAPLTHVKLKLIYTLWYIIP